MNRETNSHHLEDTGDIQRYERDKDRLLYQRVYDEDIEDFWITNFKI